mmetsp:Transcript_2905/g.4541  ORF Transcript_2905/g.4541 Transcript_2905/m.4541 type:complete len:147 (-) Transcript_2905:176-616(-)
MITQRLRDRMICRRDLIRRFSIKVVDMENGKGLRATKELRVGELICEEVAVRKVSKPNINTLEKTPSVHLELAGNIRYTNHSFIPNAYVRFGPTELAVSLVACRNIAIDDEITIDYHATESEMSNPFIDNASGKPVSGWKENSIIN